MAKRLRDILSGINSKVAPRVSTGRGANVSQLVHGLFPSVWVNNLYCRNAFFWSLSTAAGSHHTHCVTRLSAVSINATRLNEIYSQFIWHYITLCNIYSNTKTCFSLLLLLMKQTAVLWQFFLTDRNIGHCPVFN